MVSIDAKKKELVGAFKNTGRSWERAGQPVRMDCHDFPGDALGKVLPYGIYDMAANAGWVNVGTDHDTAAFAVESLHRWWNAAGKDAYPKAARLLLTADAGGSNGYRTRAWKTGLSALATETGPDITVCHFRPGTQCRCLCGASSSGRHGWQASDTPAGCIRGLGCQMRIGWGCSPGG